MEMVRLVLLTAFCLSPLAAAEFSLTIGNPIAANIPRMKTAALAVRLESCADPPKSTLTGTGEGFAAGARKSVLLHIVPAPAPGVYAVGLAAPLEGPWIANLKATCGSAVAGAMVPFRGVAFVRESIRVFPRFATQAEVESSLKEQSGGPK